MNNIWKLWLKLLYSWHKLQILQEIILLLYIGLIEIKLIKVNLAVRIKIVLDKLRVVV
jgi:hypothetical protein